MTRSNHNGMLEMCGTFAIPGNNTPFVWQHPDASFTHGDHRLYSDTHTRLEHYSIPSFPVVGHRGIFVHLTAYTMSGKLAHHTITLCFAEILDGGSNIAYMLSGYGLLDAFVETGLGGLQKLFHFIRNLAYTESVAAVSVVSIEKCPTVHRDDITVFEDICITRYAVYNHMIDRGTD